MERTCIDCGGPTQWSGRGRPRVRCPECGKENARLVTLRCKRARYAAAPEKFKAARREQEKRKKRCSYEGCQNPQVHADGLCRSHHSRLVRTGTPDGLTQRAKRGGINADGYRKIRFAGRTVFEHRVVMERMIGRPLLAAENVHHINGDKLDNRPENLELWSTAQPAGQRVTDKVAWALDLLALYAPEELIRNTLLAVPA